MSPTFDAMCPRKRVKRIAVIGPTGAGEKATVLSLFQALFIQPVVGEVAYPVLSADLRAELGERRKLRKAEAGVEPIDLPRLLRFDWADGSAGGCVVEVVALPAAAMYPDGRVDSRRLANYLRSEGYDLVVLVLNPHALWVDLGRPAFHRVILRYMALGRKAESSAYTLGDATLLSSQAVFDLKDAAFQSLNIGWESLPDSVKQLRFTRAHRGRDIEKILEAEGIAAEDIAEYMRALDLIVQAACGETGELAIVRDLLKMPHCILGLTHFDIGETSGLTKPDYETFADRLLPDDRERFRRDIVYLKNVHIEMQPPPLDPVYLRDVRPDGGLDLWEAAKPHLRAVSGYSLPSEPVRSEFAEAVEAPLPQFKPAPTPAAVVREEFQMSTPPPAQPTRVAVAREWVVRHPRWSLGVVGAVLATVMAFAAGGVVAGVAVLIALWAGAVGVLVFHERRKVIAGTKAANDAIEFAQRGTNLDVLRNGHHVS